MNSSRSSDLPVSTDIASLLVSALELSIPQLSVLRADLTGSMIYLHKPRGPMQNEHEDAPSDSRKQGGASTVEPPTFLSDLIMLRMPQDSERRIPGTESGNFAIPNCRGAAGRAKFTATLSTLDVVNSTTTGFPSSPLVTHPLLELRCTGGQRLFVGS